MSGTLTSVFQMCWQLGERISETLAAISVLSTGEKDERAILLSGGTFSMMLQSSLAASLRTLNLSPNVLVGGGVWAMDVVGLQDPRGRFASVWRSRTMRLTPLGQLVIYYAGTLFGLELPRGMTLSLNWNSEHGAMPGLRPGEYGADPFENLPAWQGYEPVASLQFPPRLRPKQNLPGQLTSEPQAVREVAQNMEVQNRNTLLFEGVSKSYRGDGGPTLLPPAKRGHTLGLFTHTPGPGIWDGDPTLQAMVSVQVVRTTKGSDSSRFVPQGVPIGLLQQPYYYLSAIRRRGDMINASLMKRSLKRGFLLDAAPQEGAELVYGIRVTNPRLLGVVVDRSPSALLFSFGYSSQTKKENVFVSTLTNPPAVIQVGAIRKRDATSDADASEKKLPRQTRPPGAAPPLGNVPGVPDAMEEVERNAPLVPELAEPMGSGKNDDDGE